MSALGRLTHNLFSFSGRMRRRDFWLCTLALWAVNVVAFGGLFVWYGFKVYPTALAMQAGRGVGQADMAQMATYTAIFGFGILGVMAITLWPNLAVNGKRLHDRGRSAGAAAIFYLPLLFTFVPVIGQVIFGISTLAVFAYWLVDLGILDGDRRGNRYGPSPKMTGLARPEEVFA